MTFRRTMTLTIEGVLMLTLFPQNRLGEANVRSLVPDSENGSTTSASSRCVQAIPPGKPKASAAIRVDRDYKCARQRRSERAKAESLLLRGGRQSSKSSVGRVKTVLVRRPR